MMKRTLFLLPLLMFFCMNSMAQNVTLLGKQFRLNGERFYPIRLCYVINIGLNGNGDYFLAPHVHYNSKPLDFDCEDESACTTKLQDNFDQIAGMGFNTVRITGLKPVYVPAGNHLAMPYARTKPYEWEIDYLPIINPSDPSDPAMHALISFYEKILEVANATKPPLKVILTVTDPDSLKAPEVALWGAYLATISSHLKTSTNSNALFAYNLASELGYNSRLKSKTKREACEIFSGWYDIVKTNDPNHLVCYGTLGTDDIFAFDPSILTVDFLALHYYPDFKPYEDRTLPNIQDRARKRIANQLYWLNQASIVSWIMGETGFSACDTCSIGAHGVMGTLNDQGAYAQFSLNATCNCGGSGFSWWQYQEVGWQDPDENHFGLLKRRYDPCPEAEKQPVVNKFRNYVSNNFPPQSTGICPVDYSATFNTSKIYYNPYQHNPPTQEPKYKFGRYVKDQYGNPIKDAAVRVWSFFGMDTITIIQPNGIPKDTAVQRYDAYYTHTDANGYFEAIACTQQYGFEIENLPEYPGLWHIDVSAAGASIYISAWRDEGDLWKYVPDTIKLNKIKDDVVVNGVTVLSGQTKVYKGRRSLTVLNTTVNSSGNATFTSQKNITFLPGFVAHAGSHVMAYIALPDCSETPLREEREGMMNVGFSMKTTNSMKIELLFEVDSTNSTKTAEIEVDFEADVSGDFISVFPNPANSTVTVQLHSGNLEASLGSIKLMDLTGREILMQQVNGKFYTMDVSTYPKGVYFIEAKDINKIYHQKIIIN